MIMKNESGFINNDLIKDEIEDFDKV